MLNKLSFIILSLFIISCTGNNKPVRVVIVDNSINKNDFFKIKKISLQSSNKSQKTQKTKKTQQVKQKKANKNWAYPVQLKVIQGFSKDNQGLVFAIKDGVSVKSIASGIVVYSSDSLKNYGKMIIVKHKYGFYSHYMFNKKTIVKVGDKVKKSQTIAFTGKNSLFLSMKKFSTVINPSDYL